MAPTQRRTTMARSRPQKPKASAPPLASARSNTNAISSGGEGADTLRANAIAAAAVCCVSVEKPAVQVLPPISDNANPYANSNANSGKLHMNTFNNQFNQLLNPNLNSSSSPQPSQQTTAIVDNRLVVGSKTLANLRTRLRNKATAMQQIPIDRSKGVTAFQFAVFCPATNHFLNTTESVFKNNDHFDFAELVLPIFAAQARVAVMNYPERPSWSDDDVDTLLLAATALFIGTLHEIISAEPNNAATLRHKFFENDQPFLRLTLSKFLNNVESASASVGNDGDTIDHSNETSLHEWLRIIASSSREEYLHLSKPAKSKAMKDFNYSLFCLVKDELEGRTPASSEFPFVETMRQDFKSIEDFEVWKSEQIRSLNASISLYDEAYGINKGVKRVNLLPDQLELVFPSQRIEYYKYILTLCLNHDVKRIEDGIFVLNNASEKLLRECASRWHISDDMREVIFMDVLIGKYSDNVWPLFEVQARVNQVMENMKEHCLHTKRSEDDYFFANLRRLQMFVHSNLNQFPDLLKSKFTKWEANQELQTMTKLYYSCALFLNGGYLDAMDFEQYLHGLFTDVLYVRYQKMSGALNKKEDLQGMINLSQSISQDLGDFELYFPDPIYDRAEFKVHLIAQDVYISKNFIIICDGLKYYRQTKRIVERNAVELVFGPNGLYMEISALFDQIGQKPDIVEWFLPFIEDWLKKMENEWAVWATNTIKNDDFEPIAPPAIMYSSSIRDLFGFYNVGVKFMKQLKTSAQRHREEALTVRFLSIMGRSLQTFANETSKEIESLVATDEVVNFTSQQCVKINNIIGAIRQLHLTFAELNVSGTHGGGREIDPAAKRVDKFPGDVTVCFTVVRAYDLDIVDSFSSDPYARLFIGENPDGWKTRVVKTNINPVWNESTGFRFSAASVGSFPFRFEICDEDLVQKDRFMATMREGDEINFADAEFNDYLAHTKEFQLVPKGRLVVKAWREGHVEDRVFWVKKSLQILEETAEKMVRIFTDKVTRYAELQWTDIANAFNTKLFKTSAVLDESTIEKSLIPLLQYLDSNLAIMNQFLERPLLDQFLRKAFMNTSNSAVGSTIPEDGEAQNKDTDSPSLVSLVLWNELVTRMKCSIESIGVIVGNRVLGSGNLGEADKRKVVALAFVLEYLKAFFYCDLDGRCCGFSLAVLEDKEYKIVREIVRKMVG
ncbi:UNVERIFIED_CONTAM: hypothetical protein HDU68_007852 [Siphonaria sp. JEL0065]|nr:hypothetical protein HDU68_007852 [Siphonaria sp. JEL0065]